MLCPHIGSAVLRVDFTGSSPPGVRTRTPSFFCSCAKIDSRKARERELAKSFEISASVGNADEPSAL